MEVAQEGDVGVPERHTPSLQQQHAEVPGQGGCQRAARGAAAHDYVVVGLAA